MARRKGQPGELTLAGFDSIVPLGRGGFSTVYRAREITANRPVALKVLDVRDAPPHVVDMFRREAHALGALSSHPHIVTLYRVLETGDRRPVLVLELCDRSMIDVLRASGSVHALDAVSVGVKVAGALESAHRSQILHRDIKPQNILITGYGEPALADFGVAGLHAASADTGAAIGFTTLHAAPELLEGTPATPATDVYELASTVYHLIAGQAAFVSYPGEAPAAVILRILRDPVAPLVVDGVPTALSDVLLASMAKDPSQRPSTALELAEALRDVQLRRGWPVTSYAVLGQAPPEPVAPPVVRPEPVASYTPEPAPTPSYAPDLAPTPIYTPPPVVPAPAPTYAPSPVVSPAPVNAPAPVHPGPVHAGPVHAGPVHAGPVHAGPVHAAPVPHPTPTAAPTPPAAPVPPVQSLQPPQQPAPTAAAPPAPAPPPAPVDAPGLPVDAQHAAQAAARNDTGWPAAPTSLGAASAPGGTTRPNALERTIMREGSMIPPELRAELDAGPQPTSRSRSRSKTGVLIGAAIVAAVIVIALLILLAARMS